GAAVGPKIGPPAHRPSTRIIAVSPSAVNVLRALKSAESGVPRSVLSSAAQRPLRCATGSDGVVCRWVSMRSRGEPDHCDCVPRVTRSRVTRYDLARARYRRRRSAESGYVGYVQKKDEAEWLPTSARLFRGALPGVPARRRPNCAAL